MVKFGDFLSSFLQNHDLSGKGVHSKRIECAPKEYTFFSFRVDPFRKGFKTIVTELPPTPESVQFPLRYYIVFFVLYHFSAFVNCYSDVMISSITEIELQKL